MVTNKERLIWLAIVFLAVVATVVVTKSRIPSQFFPIERRITLTKNITTPEPTQNLVPVIATATSTQIPCISSSQAQKTEFQELTQVWFQSPISQVPGHDQYHAWDNWTSICSTYQAAVSDDAHWVHNPISIAIMTISLTNSDNFLPDRVVAIARPEHNQVIVQNETHETIADHNVVIVVFSVSHLLIPEAEIRVDLVRENGIWQIMWIGSRVKCNSTDVDWMKQPQCQ